MIPIGPSVPEMSAKVLPSGLTLIPPPVKPGWQTTEFWLALLAMVPTLAVSLGLIPKSDQTRWDDIAAKLAGGVVGAVAVYSYVRSRAAVKTGSSNVEAIVTAATKTAGVALLACLLLPGSAPAQQPCSFLPWRAQMERRMQQQEKGGGPQAAPAPAPAPIIINPSPAPQQPAPYVSPYQQQPAPYNLGPPPMQQIPLGPAPQQQIPLGPPPMQQIPLGPAPQQQIPLGPTPQQQIPLGPAPLQIIYPQPVFPHPQIGLPEQGPPQTLPLTPAPAPPISPAPAPPHQQIPLGPPQQQLPLGPPAPTPQAPGVGPAAPVPPMPLQQPAAPVSPTPPTGYQSYRGVTWTYALAKPVP